MSKPKILIVDDRRENLYTLQQILRRVDVDVIAANSGMEALGLVLEHPFCLAIVDVQMPEMDGYELVSLLRGNMTTAVLPIIFVSAIFSDEYHHRKGYESGAVDFLSKPFVPEILLSKVQVFVDLYNQRQQLEMVINKLQETNKMLAETQSQLLQQERLAVLGQLSGNMGHELGNPLGVIANSTYFLKMLLSNAGKEVAEYLTIIDSEVAEANRIIRDFLPLSFSKSSIQRISAIDVLVDDAVMRVPMDDTITVVIEVPQTLPAVLIDWQQIEQVLVNLIRNACQAMVGGGILTIRAEVAAEAVHIRVIDTGVGMSPPLLEEIFSPLFTTRVNGLGLGLVIARHLADLNHAVISVTSEEGKGSEFVLTLPISFENA